MRKIETNYEYHKRIARRKRDWNTVAEAFALTSLIIGGIAALYLFLIVF